MDGNQPAQDARIQKVQQRSAPAGTTSAELVKYVLVELDVARENHKKFQDAMPDLVELMFDHKRWELVFASYPITGRVNRFVHIWKIPDESTLVEVMRDGAVELTPGELPAPGSFDEVFRTHYLGVQALIESTKHRLMTALPYDPTHVGFQSQTVLIDAEGEAFIIDHATLRAKVGDLEYPELADISEELEQVRRVKFTRRNRANEAMPQEPAAAAVVAKLSEPRIASLERVQKHLNRGSAVARLEFEGENALLFNLASLKSKSVYQAVELGDPADEPSEPKLGAVAGNGEADLPVERLLVAMPWGGVYDLKGQALQKLARPIPQEHAADTEKALEPLREGLTPVAAIPEERDDVIGDGCACFVINLQSFVAAAGRASVPARPAGVAAKKKA